MRQFSNEAFQELIGKKGTTEYTIGSSDLAPLDFLEAANALCASVTLTADSLHNNRKYFQLCLYYSHGG